METDNAEETLNNIIEAALTAHASDIHIDPVDRVLIIFFRIDGILYAHKEYPLFMHEGIMLRIKVLARLPIDDKRLPKDGRFKWFSEEKTRTAEVRVSMMPTVYGENAVLRLFDPMIDIFTLKELGFSDNHVQTMEKALSYRSGLIMIVGPTGSGKTTTLYSILSYLKGSGRLIITVEDPIERHIEGIRQIEVGGTSFLEYVTVLRAILRQDPDVIMIGEIRDKEGAELAIQSALTGHLVISTLHATSVFGVKKRLVNMGVAEYLVDATLITALSQRLVSKICQHCMQDEDHLSSYAGWFLKENISLPATFLKKGSGCTMCAYTGLSGRIVVTEILNEEKVPLYMDAYRKAEEGILPLSEVIKVSQEYAMKSHE
jgi:type IV pilus assembly protein PilB